VGPLLRWRSRLAIGTRLVLSVAVAMAGVLILTASFVGWRVQQGLDRQLRQDLATYHAIVVQDVRTNGDLPVEGPGVWYQVVAPDGRVQAQSTEIPVSKLFGASALRSAFAGHVAHTQRDALFHPGDRSYLAVASAVRSSSGRVVVATAISRAHRDQALRELMLQLAIADVLVLLAASYVGYRTARGALNPVERYRRAAEVAGERPGARLPVATDRDDELTRLGHTFNDLLGRLEASTLREHQFLADASHELRSPLALLKAEIEFALNRPRTQEQTLSTLRSVQAQSDRLVDLANSLLDLEEIDSLPSVSRSEVDVSDLIGAVAERCSAAFAQAGRRIRVDAPDVTVLASPRWLDAAVGNLVTNALRHGAGDVSVVAQVDGDRLRVSVTDQGPGFPADFVAKAFDRFSRAEESRTTTGSGLGLAVVAAVAANHGGTVRIEAAEGQGARVVLDIVCPPVRRKQRDRRPDAMPTSEPATPGTSRAGGS
jgi:signal transduction histidine kinase